MLPKLYIAKNEKKPNPVQSSEAHDRDVVFQEQNQFCWSLNGRQPMI